MTTETRIVFEIEDLTTVRIVCKSCRHESVYNLSDKKLGKAIQSCPWCNREWLHRNEKQWERLNSLLTNFINLPDSEEYTVKFEMLAQTKKDDISDG